MRSLLILLLVVMIGCAGPDGPDCNGYTSEPGLQFKNRFSEKVSIYFLNEFGNGDTIVITESGTYVPVDIQSDTMFYELIVGDSSYGNMDLVYSLEQSYCESRDDMKLVFRNARFISETAFLHLYMNSNGRDEQIDTNADISEFANETIRDFFFEIRP